MKKIIVLAAIFCIILLAGCSVPSLNESSGSDSDSENVVVPSEPSKAYGSIVTAPGMIQAYCYYASDLSSLKSQAQQKAIQAWEDATDSSWTLAADKSFNWLVNPAFTGAGTYFVYVQAIARPYIPDPPDPPESPEYGTPVVTAGTAQAYCYSASDLDSLRSLAQSRAIDSWEDYTDALWSQAADKSFNWRVNPTFTGYGTYFVYVQAIGSPLLP